MPANDEPVHFPQKPRRRTVLIMGEGEDEVIFLRHLDSLYRRKNIVTVQTRSAGGGEPLGILNRFLRARNGEKRDHELVVLDTDKPWPDEMREIARNEGVELIGNSPCLEALFLEILGDDTPRIGLSSTRHKKIFRDNHCEGGNFDEDECCRIFPKHLLNEARVRIPILDGIIKKIEGDA